MEDRAGIRIYPGQWRPHDRCEHIAWISPPWECPDYLWLDFPEAVFTDRGLLYLSHHSPRFPPAFEDLPAVAWEQAAGGIRFERRLADGVGFGGAVTRSACGRGVDLELHIDNGSDRPLADVRLQTCAYLRALGEFNAPTNANKWVHLPTRGWTHLGEAATHIGERGRYRVGWRGGPQVADLPVIVCTSSREDRLIAFTWGRHTYSMIGNPLHPCMHADPAFGPIQPGGREAIRGRLLFLHASLESLDPAAMLGP